MSRESKSTRWRPFLAIGEGLVVGVLMGGVDLYSASRDASSAMIAAYIAAGIILGARHFRRAALVLPTLGLGFFLVQATSIAHGYTPPFDDAVAWSGLICLLLMLPMALGLGIGLLIRWGFERMAHPSIAGLARAARSATRFRFTLWKLMLVIAVAAMLSVGAREGMKAGIRMKEEVRARRAVVRGIIGMLAWSETRSWSLRWRIAKSERQTQRDERHEHWVEELAAWQAIAATNRKELPVFKRLAAFPWLPFNDRRRHRDYTAESEQAYRNRVQEPGATRMWSAAGGALGGILVLLSVLLTWGPVSRVLHLAGDWYRPEQNHSNPPP